MLVGHPEFFRVHKGFVIKPRRHQPTKGPDYAHDINVNTGPAIDTGGFKTLIEFHLSGFKVGNGTRPRAQLNNAIGLFGTMAKDTSRSGIFKTATDHINAIGQQCRSQGVTGDTLIGFAIKSEINSGASMSRQTINASKLTHELAPVIVGWVPVL